MQQGRSLSGPQLVNRGITRHMADLERYSCATPRTRGRPLNVVVQELKSEKKKAFERGCINMS